MDRKVDVFTIKRTNTRPSPLITATSPSCSAHGTGYAQFEDAFRAAGVLFITDGGRGFYDKFEVGARSSLYYPPSRGPAIPLALAAALRSPLYGFLRTWISPACVLKNARPARGFARGGSRDTACSMRIMKRDY